MLGVLKFACILMVCIRAHTLLTFWSRSCCHFFLTGPRLGNSPVPSIVQCLARKDGTDDFYQLKVSGHTHTVFFLNYLFSLFDGDELVSSNNS